MTRVIGTLNLPRKPDLLSASKQVDALVKKFKEHKIDILALQELHEVSRQMLLSKTGFRLVSAAPNNRKTATIRNAIMVRDGVKFQKLDDLVLKWRGTERGALYLPRISVDGSVAVGVHLPTMKRLSATSRKRRAMHRLLIDAGNILLGDFNQRTLPKEYRDAGFKHYAPEAVDPKRRIDLIVLKNMSGKNVRVLRVPGLTDHPGIVLANVETLGTTTKEKKMTRSNLNVRVIRRARKMSVRVKTREQWGSRHLSVYSDRLANRPVRVKKADTLVQHITVTRDDGDLVGHFYADMREVERIGYERFKSGVSYNWCIDMKTGMVGEGQDLLAKGTHTVNDKKMSGYSYDQNHAARAMAMIGMPTTPLSRRAREHAARMYAAMILEGALTDDPDYKPHSFFAAKDCPCDATRNQMAWIRRRALQLVKEQRALDNGTAPAKVRISARERAARRILADAGEATGLKVREWMKKAAAATRAGKV